MDRRHTVMLIVTLVLAVIIMNRGIVASPQIAIDALIELGYTDIEINEHKWLLGEIRFCPSGYSAHFTATATDPQGKSGTVHVCTGFRYGGVLVAD